MGGISLTEYKQDGHTLDAGSFASRHGDAFLVHRGEMDQDVRVTQTLDTDMSRTVADKHRSPLDDFVVYPLAADPKTTRMIMVGRMQTNEVVIEADTVSEIHAILKRDDKGVFSLQDAGSRNGTFVNGTQVPEQGDGAPVPLQTGCRVSLGTCNFTFLDGSTFHRFVNSFYRS